MRKNKIAILALAAVVLAVVTSGMASASETYTYDGMLWSHLTGSTVTLDGQSSGYYDVDVDDHLKWSNYWGNNNIDDVTGKAPYSTLYNSLSNSDYSCTVPGYGHYQTQFDRYIRLDPGSMDVSINIYHQYVGYGGTDMSTSMSYNV